MDMIGIDIGGTYLRIGAVAEDPQVRHFRKIHTASVFCTQDPLEDLARFLKAYIRENGLKVKAAAIGFPATVDRDRTRVLQAPNVPFMENLPVAAYLKAALGFPVFIERDVCLTVLYDMQQVPPCEVLIGCYFGTGLGNVICLNGRPLLGKHGVAGELGHIPVHNAPERCGCGNQGCMELKAGGKFLEWLSKEVYRDTHISELFAKHGQEPYLLEFVEYMAEAVATEINILDPDYVLIGGGIPNMPAFPKALLEERIRAHTRKPFPEQDLRLVFTGDSEEKGVLGAAIHAKQRL